MDLSTLIYLALAILALVAGGGVLLSIYHARGAPLRCACGAQALYWNPHTGAAQCAACMDVALSGRAPRPRS